MHRITLNRHKMMLLQMVAHIKLVRLGIQLHITFFKLNTFVNLTPISDTFNLQIQPLNVKV